ncbi:MAG TPA: hypothetical protein VER37_10205 [Thermomicrobiales bacterium]|nr:hypothetical protein [Thermomicrobiales bacterium]
MRSSGFRFNRDREPVDLFPHSTGASAAAEDAPDGNVPRLVGARSEKCLEPGQTATWAAGQPDPDVGPPDKWTPGEPGCS